MRCVFLKKRRLWLIFVFLIIAWIFSLLAVVTPYLVNEFKIFVQKKITENFDIKVDFGKVKGGMITPLIFEKLTVLRGERTDFFVCVRAEAVSSNYYIWDLLLAQVYGYKDIELIFKNGELFMNSPESVLSQIEGHVAIDKTQTANVDLIARHKSDKLFLRGSIHNKEEFLTLDLDAGYVKDFSKITFSAEGSLAELNLKGSVYLTDEKEMDFTSRLKIGSEEVEFEEVNFNGSYFAHGSYKIKEKKFAAEVIPVGEENRILTLDFQPVLAQEHSLENNDITEDSERNGVVIKKPFLLKMNFSHFNLFGKDIISFVEARGGNIGQDGFGFKFSTYGTTINRRPCDELKMDCYFREGVLYVDSVQLGKEHLLSGIVDFKEQPAHVKLNWQVREMALRSLLMLSENADDSARLDGILNGNISVEGNVLNPFIKIALSGKKGNFLGMEFASANVNLDGNYPVLLFHDSRIYRDEGGFFILGGRMDLRKIHTTAFFDDIKILTNEKTIVLDGWDISRGQPGQSELTLKKAVSNDLKVGFKTFLNGQEQNALNEDSALELEYEFQKNRSLLMRFEKDNEFFGVKQGTKF
ncbi:MAG: hypothetical protein ABH836_01085 [Candidatus Omnitrophota bacterium]